MNIAKVPPANTIIGSNYGHRISGNSNYNIWNNNSNVYVSGVSMNYLDILWTLFRWKNDGWEVHPINLDDEFPGWI